MMRLNLWLMQWLVALMAIFTILTFTYFIKDDENGEIKDDESEDDYEDNIWM